MRWLRLDAAFDKSDWLFVLSAESQLGWIKMLCYVKVEGIRGVCKAMSPIVAAKVWGIGEEAVHKLLQAAIKDGALRSDGKTWEIVNWDRFQEQDSTAAERMRNMRKRRAEPVTESDGVTPVTPVTFGVTRRVTETETETIPLPPTEVPPGEAPSPPTFADFWTEYPKRAGDRKRAESERKFALAVKRGVDPGLIVDGAKRYRAFCDATGKIGTEFVQQAPTWLNGMAWENDFTLPAEPAKAGGTLPKSDEPERLGTRATREGRLVYVWQGQDLSIDDAVKWHEDRNRALPPELERALEAA